MPRNNRRMPGRPGSARGGAPPSGGRATIARVTSLAIQARGLVKRFGTLSAVDGLDLEVPRGACYAFLGPNGAGKSTTIGLLTGLFPPDGGHATLLGFDLAAEPLEVKRRIGVVPEELALFERLSGLDYLVFCGRMYGLDAGTARARAEELLALTELAPRAGALVADYSKGMRRRLAIAAALIHGPELVFLDEPFEGIDVVAGAVIRALLAHLRSAGVTILLTTHVFEIAERLATHAGVVVAGRLATSGTVEALRAAHGASTLEDVFHAVVGVPAASGATLSWYRSA